MGATTASPDDQDLATRVAELEATVARLSAALEARPPAPPTPSSRLEALGGLGGLGSDTGIEADPTKSRPLTPLTPPATLHDGPAAPEATDAPDGDEPRRDEPRRDEPRRDEPVRVDRRRLLGRAGVVAAGAVLGGAAATVATASPAAAATGSFDTSTATPAVIATSTGTGAAIKAEATGTGSALAAVGNVTNSAPVISATSTNGTALSVTSSSLRPAVDIYQAQALVSVYIECPGGSVATYSVGKNVGVLGETKTDPTGIGIVGRSTGTCGVLGEGAGGTIGTAGYSPSGLGVRAVGGRAQIGLRQAAEMPALVPPPNRTDAHDAGEIYFDDDESLWLCVAGGTPGTWVRLAGPATAGALTVLPTPTRVYDSRPGQPPNIAPQTKLTANTPRTGIALTTNNSGIPTDASAAIITATVVNTAGGAPGGPGFLTVYPDGIPAPSTSNLNWTSAGAVVANTTTVALGPGAKIAAFANRATDLIIDAIGYYR